MSTPNPDQGKFAVASMKHRFEHDYADKRTYATSKIKLHDGTEVIVDERERKVTVSSPHVLASGVPVVDPENLDEEIGPTHEVHVWRMN